jgi:hypothetical protein
MRSMTESLVVAVAGVAMVAASAGANDYQDEMREMREMVLKLQDQIEAQQDQIDDQQDVIQEAGLEDERGSSSALSSFLESTDFNGWVAASYFWNFNNPRKPNAGGNGPYSNPFHADHNSFQFDEAWFVMDRAPTEESPAGFHFEILYGATATAFSNIDNGGPSSGNLNGNDLWIPSANVSYLTPWSQTVTAGKFGTTIGYEVAGAPSNVNITRGFTYNLFQPISHTGATVSQDFDNGMTYTLGIVNGFGTEQFDTNMGKGFLWQVGWGNDSTTLLFNGIYDSETPGNGDETYVLDVVAEMTPSDDVLLWLNYDYIRTNGVSGDDPDGHGLSLGGHLVLTEKMGIGARFEYAHLDDDSGTDGDLFSWTTTGDYALTDNLTWKLEYKYEASDDLPQAFRKKTSGNDFNSSAHYIGTQVYYEF